MDISLIPTEIGKESRNKSDIRYSLMVTTKHSLFKSEKSFTKELSELNKADTKSCNLYLLEILMNLPKSALKQVLPRAFRTYEIVTLNGIPECLVFRNRQERDRFINTVADLYFEASMASKIKKEPVEIPEPNKSKIILP